MFFLRSCGSGGFKSRLAKAAGAKPCGQRRNEKWHAAAAPSTFTSQNVQNTPFFHHFWKFKCPKMARDCGAKHIFSSKCTTHTILHPLLKVQMSKHDTPLWHEAHLQLKMLKKLTVPSHFWKVGCQKMARRCGAKHIYKSKRTNKTCVLQHFWRFRCRKGVQQKR